MERDYRICKYCSEKHCCRGLCKEMNEYLTRSKKKNKNTSNRKWLDVNT
jgi:hypothetical protein